MRSAMRAASQLPGRGPTVVDMALYLHVNQKSDDDDDDENYLHQCLHRVLLHHVVPKEVND